MKATTCHNKDTTENSNIDRNIFVLVKIKGRKEYDSMVFDQTLLDDVPQGQ